MVLELVHVFFSIVCDVLLQPPDSERILGGELRRVTAVERQPAAHACTRTESEWHSFIDFTLRFFNKYGNTSVYRGRLHSGIMKFAQMILHGKWMVVGTAFQLIALKCDIFSWNQLRCPIWHDCVFNPASSTLGGLEVILSCCHSLQNPDIVRILHTLS